MRGHFIFGLPFVTLEVFGREIDALVDTGFSGALMLPKDLVEASGKKSSGTIDFGLADGTMGSSEIYDIDN